MWLVLTLELLIGLVQFKAMNGVGGLILHSFYYLEEFHGNPITNEFYLLKLQNVQCFFHTVVELLLSL